MAIVGSFSSRPHAEMAAAMLQSHGIEAHVLGDDAGGTAPHFTFAIAGGYAISVPDADRDDAVELLAEESRPLGGSPDAFRGGALRTILRVALVVFVVLVVTGWLTSVL